TEYQRTVTHWRDRIRTVSTTGGATVIWGGGSKGVAFLAALGPAAALVDGVVDINPFKQNQYMAGTGHLVLAPKDLVDLEPALVIVMNTAYRDEIGQELAGLGLTPIVEALWAPRGSPSACPSTTARPTWLRPWRACSGRT